MNVAKTMENLKKRGFTVSYFDTAAQAADYLDRSIDSQSVGVGGSVTLRDMGVYEKLAAHNEVFWQWYAPKGTSQEETYRKAERADVYLSSVNAIAETGEILNIDGRQSGRCHTVRPQKALPGHRHQ